MNYYNQFKEELIKSEIKVAAKDYSKNKIILNRNYNIGKILIEAQGGEKRAKYGNKLIAEYSDKFYKETGERYSYTLLKNMRSFYLFIENGQPMADQLSASHYELLFSIKDKDEVNYYIKTAIDQRLSKRELKEKIKNKEYARLDEKTKEKIKNKESLKLAETIKEPIIIKKKAGIDSISEYTLKELILENIENFMNELGEGYSYIANEYKIKIGSSYNYIDLLLFNYKYNAFVVIELKVTTLKKEHIGQIITYVEYIDRNIKNISHNKTIGIIIVKRNNKFIMEYSTDERILARKYILI